MLNSIVEIVKYSVPALIVFITVYYLFKNFLFQQYQMEALRQQKNIKKEIIPLKLQAYERLIMLCERISVDNLVYRLSNTDMGVKELKNAMLIAIQQEFEHNITQQIYVSENLWKILKLAKEQMQEFIAITEGNAPADFITNIYKNISDAKADPIAYATKAIKNEADLLM